MKLTHAAVGLVLFVVACGPSPDAGGDSGAPDAASDAAFDAAEDAGSTGPSDGEAAADAADAAGGSCSVDGGTVSAGQGCGPGSQCVGGACTIPTPAACDVHVPGDYATPQEAVTALRKANQKATVCLADGTYPGNLDVDYGTAELTLVGSSASRVTIGGPVTVPATLNPPALVRFRGVTITENVESWWSIALEDCAVRGSVILHQSTQWDPNQDAYATIDSCDLSAPGGDAVEIELGGCMWNTTKVANPFHVNVQNDWIHDSILGISFQSAGCGSATVQVVGNTLRGNGTGISIAGPASDAPATTFVANVIVGSKTAITSNRSPTYGNQTIDDMRDNALFDDTATYGGLATPGAGYIVADPKLGSGAPPAPLAGSPLLGAGDAKVLPSHDFFGFARVRADVGAVEGP